MSWMLHFSRIAPVRSSRTRLVTPGDSLSPDALFERVRIDSLAPIAKGSAEGRGGVDSSEFRGGKSAGGVNRPEKVEATRVADVILREFISDSDRRESRHDGKS